MEERRQRLKSLHALPASIPAYSGFGTQPQGRTWLVVDRILDIVEDRAEVKWRRPRGGSLLRGDRRPVTELLDIPAILRTRTLTYCAPVHSRVPEVSN